MGIATRRGVTGWGPNFELVVSSTRGMAKLAREHEDGSMTATALAQVGYSCSSFTRNIRQVFHSERHGVGAGRVGLSKDTQG